MFGLHQGECPHQVEEGDASLLLSTGEALPGMLCPGLGSSVPKRHGSPGQRWGRCISLSMKGKECLSWGKVLRAGIVQPGNEKVQCMWNPISVYKYVRRGCEEEGAGLLWVVPSARSRGRGQKLDHRTFSLNIGVHFCAVKVMDHWKRLSREAVECPLWRS